MNNLTLASAKHLMNMGHITPQHHAKIVGSIKPLKLAPPPQTPALKIAGPKGAKAGFGSLVQPQQAQAPIPGAMGAPAVPPGTATDYE
jgi:hypothetical protein